MEYIIYTDESGGKGSYFSNFYGGALVRSSHIREVEHSLISRKKELYLFKEIKWQRVTLSYLDKYIALMDTFFDLIEQDKVKIRIMFTHNAIQATELTPEQKGSEYLLLYYQFIKHAFGLRYSNPNPSIPIRVRLYLDELPVCSSDSEKFKNFIAGLTNQPEFQEANIILSKEDITEVSSHKHVILQYVDVVLGAMYFRLNDLHLKRPPGKRIRGKRTRAKEKLYKHINSRIRKIYPGFNIGVSTGRRNVEDLWNHQYRHWKFEPSNSKYVEGFAKNNKI